MTFPAPLVWSADLVDDGRLVGRGSLLGTITFDPDWDDGARRVNLVRIVEAANAYERLRAAVEAALGFTGDELADRAGLDGPLNEARRVAALLSAALEPAFIVTAGAAGQPPEV